MKKMIVLSLCVCAHMYAAQQWQPELTAEQRAYVSAFEKVSDVVLQKMVLGTRFEQLIAQAELSDAERAALKKAIRCLIEPSEEQRNTCEAFVLAIAMPMQAIMVEKSEVFRAHLSHEMQHLIQK